MSKKQQKIIEDSESKKEFTQRYNELAKKDNMEMLTESHLNAMKEVVKKIDDQKLNRGIGAESMRQAINMFI